MAARELFRQAGAALDRDRRRDPRRAGQGAGLFQSRPLSASARASGSPTCSSRMQEDGVIAATQMSSARRRPPACRASCLRAAAARRPASISSTIWCARRSRWSASDALTAQSYTVRSTIIPKLQRATEAALQDGLARYERKTGRAEFQRRRDQSRRRGPASSPRTPRPTGPRSRSGRSRCSRCGCRSTTCIGRRRWSWSASRSEDGGEIDPRRPARRPYRAADRAGGAATRAQAQAQRRDLRQGRRGLEGQAATPRAELRVRPRCRARRWCWRTRPAASSRWSAASPIR